MNDIGYLSFDASVKIHYSGKYASTKTRKKGNGGVNGYIRHIDRGTDRRNGCEVEHSNPDINSDFTLENESYYKDSDGNWKKTERSKDMVNAVNRRVQYAKAHGARISSKGQNDTVIVRPLIVQLDEDVVLDNGDSWVWDSIEILEDMFGKENIVGFSIHKDETNVHIHVVFVPCHETEKGNGQVKCTVSQTKFFRSPKQLAGMHRKIRKSLCDKGYDIEQENKPIDEQLAGYYDKKGKWHQQGLTPDQLKQLTERELTLRMEEINMRLRKEEMERLESAMRDMQKAAKESQKEMERSRETLAAQQTALENDRASVQAQMQALVEEKVAVQQMKQDAEKMLSRVYSTADVCNRILSDEKNLNKKFLEFLDREGKRTNTQVREFVERLYRKFQKERKESLSDWQLEMLRMRKEQGEQVNVGDMFPIINTEANAGYDFSL